LWRALGPSPAADRLSTRLKATFDPGGVLNPGIFGELS
jgi:FAD/FMN-containing dehydrogenase